MTPGFEKNVGRLPYQEREFKRMGALDAFHNHRKQLLSRRSGLYRTFKEQGWSATKDQRTELCLIKRQIFIVDVKISIERLLQRLHIH